jgi:predicted metal-dependent HD superfamily phosphohydrolase
MSHFSEIINFRNPNAPLLYIEYVERALISLYSYPKRGYHNWNHIIACLHELDAIGLPDIDSFKDILSLAIYYHDCVYVPENSDNEERSAERAFIDLLALGFSPSYAKWVYSHILLTTHKEPCMYLSGQVLMDIDMSILGKEPHIFQAYEDGIHQEYTFIDESSYYRYRVIFLKSLLKKDAIYQTKYFQDKYEKTARENITRCIDNLASDPT